MKTYMVSTVIPLAAVAVALVSFVVNYRASAAADRRGPMPVLVFTRTDRGVRLSNVGNGPALNIIFGLAEEAQQPVALRRGVYEHWFDPLHLRPIAPGQASDIPQATSSSGMGGSYTDALGTKYTVKTSQFGTVILEGAHLPMTWTMDSVPAIWDKKLRSPWQRTTRDGKPARRRIDRRGRLIHADHRRSIA